MSVRLHTLGPSARLTAHAPARVLALLRHGVFSLRLCAHARSVPLQIYHEQLGGDHRSTKDVGNSLDMLKELRAGE